MADTPGVDETNDLSEKPEEFEEGPLCCEGPMSADELIYWLQWYREVATLQRAAAGCVRPGGSTGTELIEDGAAAEDCAEQPAGPRFKRDSNTLSRSDYNSIPLTAGLPSGIPLSTQAAIRATS